MIRHVLITHRPGTWPGLAARFEGTEIALLFAATTIQVAPVDPGPGDRALAHLDGYDWLVVTSAHGASALVRRLDALRTAMPPRLRVAAVGPATARELRAAGIEADVLPAESSGEGLAVALRPRMDAASAILLVRPEGAPNPLAEALATAGARIDVAPLYRTVASEAASELATKAIEGGFQAVVFTAPSSLDRWLYAAGSRRPTLVAALSRVTRIAIGPTTAAHLARADLPAETVASTPTEEAIGDAIATVFRR